jgi:hypothetical protein
VHQPKEPTFRLGGPRQIIDWATKEISAAEADEGFYRICGVKGSGKTHLTKLFILDALREVERNPHAKLVVYEPKRQFYAWLKSLRLKTHIRYFMPSDRRSVTLDFTRDYASDQDSKTLANAFYPYDPNEKQRFWGDALRTIYAQVFDAIKGQLGEADLRLMCLVLEDEALTQAVLGHDLYLVQAKELARVGSENEHETSRGIRLSIQSRIAEMKVLAAHLDMARRENRVLSLRDFVSQPGEGILVVSKDSDYGLVQDPMNGVLFLRLTQLLDQLQTLRERKVFIVIDEFPTLAGDRPCPGITDMFLRLRDRGVTVLITYQAHTSLKRIYGENVTEIIGQCTNVIYLTQADVESAQYASDDLGHERGYEAVRSGSHSSHVSDGISSSNSSFGMSMVWYDRPIHSATELKNGLRPASRKRGVEGRAKSPEFGKDPWPFRYSPEEIDCIPRRDTEFEEYQRRDPEVGSKVESAEAFKAYLKLMRKTQRLKPLTTDEKAALLRSTPDRPESESWDQCQD